MTITYSYRCHAEQELHTATYATISAALAQLQQHLKCPELIEPLSLDTRQQHLDAVALHRIGAQLLALVRPLADSEPSHPCLYGERGT